MGGITQVAEDGTYVAAGVRPGRVQFFLRGSGRSYEPGPWIDVADGVELEHDIVWSVEMGTITGRVTSESGAPLPGQNVVAEAHAADGYRLFQAETAEDGSYSIDVETGLTYTVDVVRTPIRRPHENVAAGDEDVDFSLPDTGALTIQLIDAETRETIPIGHEPMVFFWRESGATTFHRMRSRQVVRGPQSFTLPLGTVDIKVHKGGDGYLPATAIGVEILKQATEPVVLELVRGAALRLHFSGDSTEQAWWYGHLLFALEESQLGAVTGPYASQGEPANHRINGINVRMEGDVTTQQLVMPDNSGHASLKGLVPGRYSIAAIPDDFVFEPEFFAVGEETDQPIEIRWRRR